MATLNDFSIVNLIHRKLDESRTLLKNDETIRSLHALYHALKLRIGHQFREENVALIDTRIHKTATDITTSQEFLRSFGPVAFALGDNKKMFDFLNSMIAAALELSEGNREEMLLNGELLLKNHRYTEAKDIFNSLMLLFPDNIDLRFRIGELYLKHELYEDAEMVFRDAQSLNPNSIHIINKLGIAFRKMKKYEDAIAEYLKAIRIDPNDPHLYYNLAVALYLKQDYSKAIKTVEHALAVKTDFPEGHELKHQIEAKMLAH
jgi:tetratricopeptide (TPR) repeat protein